MSLKKSTFIPDPRVDGLRMYEQGRWLFIDFESIPKIAQNPVRITIKQYHSTPRGHSRKLKTFLIRLLHSKRAYIRGSGYTGMLIENRTLS